MKLNRKLFAVLAALFILCTGTIAVYAAQRVTAEDFKLSVNTDKDAYNAGEEIVLSFEVINMSDQEAKRIDMGYDIPDMIKENIKNIDKLPTLLENLDSGRSFKFDGVSTTVEDNTSDNNSDNTSGNSGKDETATPPKTGDTADILLYFAIAAAAGAVLFKVYKKNGTKKLFYIFMAAVLFLGTVNSTVISAFASGKGRRPGLRPDRQGRRGQLHPL